MSMILDGEMHLSSEFDGEMGMWFLPSTDKHFVYEQHTASAAWSIEHDLEKYPSVTIVDSGGSEVIGEVQYIDKNHLIVTFAGAFSGTAYLN